MPREAFFEKKAAAALDPGIVSRLLLLKVLQRRESFRPPFSKGGRVQRQRLWSRSAERETPKPAALTALSCNAIKEPPIKPAHQKGSREAPTQSRRPEPECLPVPKFALAERWQDRRRTVKESGPFHPSPGDEETPGSCPRRGTCPLYREAALQKNENHKNNLKHEIIIHYSLFIIHYSLSRHRRRFSPGPPSKKLAY